MFLNPKCVGEQRELSDLFKSHGFGRLSGEHAQLIMESSNFELPGDEFTDEILDVMGMDVDEKPVAQSIQTLLIQVAAKKKIACDEVHVKFPLDSDESESDHRLTLIEAEIAKLAGHQTKILKANASKVTQLALAGITAKTIALQNRKAAIERQVAGADPVETPDDELAMATDVYKFPVSDDDIRPSRVDTPEAEATGATPPPEGAEKPLEEDAKPDIEFDSEMVVSLSMHHCNAPPINAIWLRNQTDEDWVDVKAVIKGDPGFFEAKIVLFDIIRAGEKRDLVREGLVFSHDYLRNIKEAVRGHISVKVVADCNGENPVEVASTNSPFEVLTANHWTGSRSYPELLATFVVPNDEKVPSLVRKASELLRANRSSHIINGYQEGHRESVMAQLSAIYTAIASKNIHYQNPPASFHSGQKIRFPADILEQGLGTCLDLALLLAGCIEAVGLRPVVLIKDGHAWVAAWLIESEFKADLVEDMLAVRKEVDAGKLICIEATALTNREPFTKAVEAAKKHLLDEQATAFDYALDITRARTHHYTPLSTHNDDILAKGTQPEVDEHGEVHIPMDFSTDLPPLDADQFVVKDPIDPNSPLGRLSRWKSALLDLTLRNTLINYKPERATAVPVISNNPSSIEDAIAGGDRLLVKPLPSDGGLRTNDRDKVIQEMADDAFKQKQILTSLTEDALNKRLTKIARSCNTSRQEGGSNTLYISLGFLKWKEAEKSERVFYAPLILVPITIIRQRAQSKFEIEAHEDETILNPTLMELLSRNFGIENFIDPNNLPTDDSGVDVPRIWQVFREQVRDLDGWEVVSDASISELQFKKHLMWKDLEFQTENILNNNNVKRLIDRSNAKNDELEFPDKKTLDDKYDPIETFCPLDADSSQLAAVYAATEGKSFVIEGPPGTGKSQTIVNILANCAAVGKRVLFVSEKLTALNVVEKRLNNVGLGPFCIEMHSNKDGKANFAKNIKQVWDDSRKHTVDEWAQKASELKILRDQLNSYVRELHEYYPNGLNAQLAVGHCLQHEQSTPLGFNWPKASTHTREDLGEMRTIIGDLAQVANDVGEISNSPFEAVTQREWTPGWQSDLVASYELLVEKTNSFIPHQAKELCELLELRDEDARTLTYADYELLNSVAKALIEAPQQPSGLRGKASLSGKQNRMLTELSDTQARYAGSADKLEKYFDSEKLRSYDLALLPLWEKACATWWLPAFFLRRKIAKLFAPFMQAKAKIPKIELGGVISEIEHLSVEAEAMRSLEESLQSKECLDDPAQPLAERVDTLAKTIQWSGDLRQSILSLSLAEPAIDHLQRRASTLATKDEDELGGDSRIGRKLFAYIQSWSEISTVMDSISNIGGKRFSEPAPDGSVPVPKELVSIREVVSRQKQLKPWCDWNRYSTVARSKGLDRVVEGLRSGRVDSDSVSQVFESSYHDWFAKQVFNERPVLAQFSSSVHGKRIANFQELDREFTELTKRYLRAKLEQNVKATNLPEAEMALMTREANKKRAHKSIREMIRTVPTVLAATKPIMLMSPLSIAQYLDSSDSRVAFDLVVFDEASQIPVWDAIGAIGRAKQVVIVGDPKQLPPTAFFGSGAKQDEEVEVEDQESILDECLSAGMPLHRLSWHYRSRNESLIAFSNQRYYDSTLITFPAPSTTDKAVSLVHVPEGVYARGKARNNLIEAAKVVEYIQSHFADKETQKLTLGVIAFSKAQQEAIEDLLDAARRTDRVLDDMCETHGDEKLFVKNLENSQGDERDVIFFSIGYGPDASGKLTYDFGPVNREGGHRRLNVAVTRAREQVVVFSSVKSEDLSPTRCKSRGLKDLKLYLEFADKGQKALAAQTEVTDREFDSPFEAEVADRIKQLGYEVHAQVGVSGYRIDLAIVDPKKPGRYLLAVECDGAMYHSGATARERDRLRQDVLEGLGWFVYRIWSTDWWMDSAKEINKLEEEIKALL
ncbi:MAG: very-short-patch-repair endonuclease [Candidatus Azotimanducaceae bacterium]|jgi:very-short-patch-repair endonuclease